MNVYVCRRHLLRQTPIKPNQILYIDIHLISIFCDMILKQKTNVSDTNRSGFKREKAHNESGILMSTIFFHYICPSSAEKITCRLIGLQCAFWLTEFSIVGQRIRKCFNDFVYRLYTDFFCMTSNVLIKLLKLIQLIICVYNV